MVIKQYRARGPVTETLLSVVAHGRRHGAHLHSALLWPWRRRWTSTAARLAACRAWLDAGAGDMPRRWAWAARCWARCYTAMLIGFSAGAVTTVMALAIAFVLAASGCGGRAGPLGAADDHGHGGSVRQFVQAALREVMAVTRPCDEPPVFMMFFVLSGAGLNLWRSCRPSALVGVIYVVVRVLGKLAGAWFGATVLNARARGCAPLAWPGALAAGGRCHWPYRGGAAGGAAICRGRCAPWCCAAR